MGLFVSCGETKQNDPTFLPIQSKSVAIQNGGDFHRQSLASVLVLFSYGHMPDTDPMPDPESPEWPVAWAAKEVLRRHLGPKFDRRLPLFLAKAILERMRLTKWRIGDDSAWRKVKPFAKDVDAPVIRYLRVPPSWCGW